MEINTPKAIVGLGNPGPEFNSTRHNIGFAILDKLADKYMGSWHKKDDMLISNININNYNILLIKPQTYMNNSGQIIPYLRKNNIALEDILIVHDELELPLGQIKLKFGGSSRGHNGLKSFINSWGDKFARLRFGIGRPEDKSQVADYVLSKFPESKTVISNLIDQAVNIIENLYS